VILHAQFVLALQLMNALDVMQRYKNTKKEQNALVPVPLEGIKTMKIQQVYFVLVNFEK
jgi:hypothetical protein